MFLTLSLTLCCSSAGVVGHDVNPLYPGVGAGGVATVGPAGLAGRGRDGQLAEAREGGYLPGVWQPATPAAGRTGE